MNKKSFSTLSLWVVTIASMTNALASLPPTKPRLGVQGYDQSQVMDIRIVPGLATLLQLPCVVEDYTLGNETTVEAKPAAQNGRNMLLKAKTHSATATNLIVQCANKILVFDIVPNATIHQDLIKVPYAFGSPKIIKDTSNLTLIDSSEMPRSKRGSPKAKLIDSSEMHQSVVSSSISKEENAHE